MVLKISAYTISQFFFLIAAFTKQFYLFSSGSFQIADLCFMLSFGFALFGKNAHRFRFRKQDRLLLIFVVCVFIINGLYSIAYSAFAFTISSLQYLYCLFVIMTFRQLSDDSGFLLKLKRTLQMGLLCQAVIYFWGIGRRFFSGFRYMGTFNDPNQYGFFILASCFIIYGLSVKLKQKPPILWIILTAVLIMPSASVGMALGYVCFVACFILFTLWANNKKAAIALFGLFAAFAIIIVLSLANVKMPASITNSFMFKRIIQKLSSMKSIDALEGTVADRGWILLKSHPWKMLYGAGAGGAVPHRFAEWGGEVHSSILGPLFDYGIIPFTFWMTWCVRQIKGAGRDLWCIYIALFVESLTLVNNRQPFFWIILILASIPCSDIVKEKQSNEFPDVQRDRPDL